MFSRDPYEEFEKQFINIFGRNAEKHTVNEQGLVVALPSGDKYAVPYSCVDELMRNPNQLIRPHIIKKHLMCDLQTAIAINRRLNYS